MSLLSKLSIVILTYNRHAFAIRNMNFWSGTDVTVHVLDGSNEAIEENSLKNLSENINYHHLPISLYDRLGVAVNLVKTEYSVLLSDDEYFVPDGIKKCIEELEGNSDLIACVGRCLYFWPRKNRITVMNYYTWWKSILQDTPQERMEESMRVLHSLTIYAVMRTDNWINCIKVLAEKEFSCVYVPEHQFELFSSYQGKAKIINALYWFRSGENHPTTFKNWNRNYELEDWYQKEGNEEEIDELFERLANHALMINPGLDKIKTKNEFKKAGYIWLEKAESGKTRMSRFKQPFRRIAEKIAANLPRNIKYPLKEMLGLTKGQFEYKEIPHKLEELGITCDNNNLNTIEKSLESFYKDIKK